MVKPLLFIIFFNDLVVLEDNGYSVIVYADDDTMQLELDMTGKLTKSGLTARLVKWISECK